MPVADAEWISCIADIPSRPMGLAVVCHGLTGDSFGPGGLGRQLAEALAEADLGVVRIDVRGGGDSSVALGQPTVSTMADDIRTVLNAPQLADLSALPKVLCGVSLGAMSAAVAALRIDGVRAVIAVSSDISDGDLRPWPTTWSRSHEHQVPDAFAADLSQHQPRGQLLDMGISLSVLVGEHDRGAAHAKLLAGQGLAVEVIPGGDHLFQDQVARTDLLRRVRSHVRAATRPRT
ncbi:MULTISPECIES: alpha/beta fold hydrolase [unclassified Streptomyces]|uniref:alpha/beta hydrolase n=1 Tax=unclassified Streptomyces TaxID=2593676 RepID=UPI00236693BE|nr:MULTISPECIES: alpha/beta fold hydrolase [unclassified Streptomyces]MDF3141164.1 alpha/beta fold hydrolase [Streptomyces sp. T21Q-yed]WDF41409.1 alpha/beta fold hydrolase [Streptomyces sp. T12]